MSLTTEVPERRANGLGRGTAKGKFAMRPKSNPDICIIEDCKKPASRRGWCTMHYARWKKWGDPLTLRYVGIDAMYDRNGPIPEHRPELGACWLYTGRSNNGGYARHRQMYERHRGPVASGYVLDHLCRNRLCGNPDHLQPVIHIENVRRGLRGRMVTHCPKGHPYDETNTVFHHGRRECLTCRRERDRGRRDAAYWREYRARRKATHE